MVVEVPFGKAMLTVLPITSRHPLFTPATTHSLHTPLTTATSHFVAPPSPPSSPSTSSHSSGGSRLSLPFFGPTSRFNKTNVATGADLTECEALLSTLTTPSSAAIVPDFCVATSPSPSTSFFSPAAAAAAALPHVAAPQRPVPIKATVCPEAPPITASNGTAGIAKMLHNVRQYRVAPHIVIPPTQKVNIMVVDDSTMNRKLIQRTLEKAFSNIVIDAYPDGWQAYQATTSKTYHIIIMDINMPVMDGMEATRLIRMGDSRNQHVPILAFTTEARQEATRQYLAAGMTDVLAKDGHSWASLCSVVERYTKVKRATNDIVATPAPMLSLPELHLPALSANRQRMAAASGVSAAIFSSPGHLDAPSSQASHRHSQLPSAAPFMADPGLSHPLHHPYRPASVV